MLLFFYVIDCSGCKSHPCTEQLNRKGVLPSTYKWKSAHILNPADWLSLITDEDASCRILTLFDMGFCTGLKDSKSVQEGLQMHFLHYLCQKHAQETLG